MSSQEVGAMLPPEGITPDFRSNTYLQYSIIIVYCTTFAIATLTMGLRLYTSAIIMRKIGLDSPLIIISWALSLAFFICMVAAMPSGFGKHMWNVRQVDLPGYLKLLLALGLTYLWPPALTKLAILVLYRRIVPSKHFHLFVYFIAFCIIAYTTVFTVLLCGPCRPLSPGSSLCINNLTVAQAILNLVSDGILIILPIPILHHLKMPLKQRATVGAILALGSGVFMASCVRIAYVRKMQNNPDITWTQASASLWSSVELNVGIICNCLPTLKPFIRKHLPWLRSLVGGTSSNKTRPSQPNSGNNFRSWRAENSTHGFQLHSVDCAGMLRENETDDSKNIVVVDEYQVHYGDASEIGDASSTEDILATENRRPHVKPA